VRRLCWQGSLVILLVALVAGCSIIEPAAPVATWEPLPALETATPTRLPPSATPSAVTSTPQPTAVPSTPTVLPSPTSVPTATLTPSRAPSPSFTLAPTRTAVTQPSATPAATPQTVEDWRGTLHSLAAGSLYDDYIQLADGQKQYGIRAEDPELAERLVSARDSGDTLHVWGLLYVQADDYGGGQILVQRLVIEPAATRTATSSGPRFPTKAQVPSGTPGAALTATPGPEPGLTPTVEPTAPVPPTQAPQPTAPRPTLPPSELVEAWEGWILALPSGSLYDDYFAVEATGAQYGIRSLVPAIQAQIVAYRDSGMRVRIWGVLDYGVSDHNGASIIVTRMEPA